MPSIAEIFIFSGVAVDIGVDVTSCVAVAGICVGVAVGMVIAVDWDDAAALWQAARKMMGRRSGMIFFIGKYCLFGA
jgi:hypothetical protein